MNKELQNLKIWNNRKYKRKLWKNITYSEKIVFNILKKNKIKFKFQKGFWTIKGKYKGYHCIVDFYIPSKRLSIEVDGGYHNSTEQKRKDIFKEVWLKNRKVYLLRIKNENAIDIIKKINNFRYSKMKKIRKPKNILWSNWKSNKHLKEVFFYSPIL